MDKKLCWSFLVNPIVQVVTILTVSVALYLMSANYLKTPHINDPSPVLVGHAPDINKTQIKTGLYVNNFLSFNLIKNDFTIDGIVWFEFDKKDLSLSELEQSVFSKGELSLQSNLLGSSKPVIQENGNTIYAQYPIKVDFTSTFDYRAFPFDSHRLHMTLNNFHLDANKYEFVAGKNNFSLSKNLVTHGWRHLNYEAITGHTTKEIAQGKTINYPRVIYAIDYERDSMKDLLLLLLPLLVTLFMSMFTFSYDHEVYRTSILSVGVATVSAMIGYRYVINNVAPQVPYFMLIDWMFALFLILGFTVFLINVFNLFKVCRGLILLILHIILVGGWYGLLYLWV